MRLKIEIEKEKRRRKYQAEKERCADDIVYWCNTYVKGYDPRKIELKEDPNVPFVLYDFQVEYLQFLDNAINEREHTVTEKSRDMGASWLCIIFDIHKWLFVPGYKAGWGSYKEDKIDRRGDMDSMFEKARHLLGSLPSWMLPSGFVVGGEYDNFMRLVNPETGATITGEAGKNIGRGGRNTRYTLDEFAFFEQAEGVDKAVSQNTNCVSYVSTPNGRGNLFAQKRFGGKLKVFTMHWTIHPDKDEAWYQEQVSKLDAITVAQEVDIDYSASVEGIMIPGAWVRASIDLFTDIPDLGIGPKIAGLDVGETTDQSCYIMREGVAVKRIEQWGASNTTQSAYKAKHYGEEDGIEKLKYDPIGIGAGVTGTLASSSSDADQDEERDQHAENEEIHSDHFELVGIPWGTADVKGEPLWDNEEKHLKERFLNQRACDWWHLRLRFQCAYEHVEGIKEHDPEHMISIPNDAQLIAELSMPLLQWSSTGKIKLESKKDMKKRGIKSPNKADSLAYCFSTYELPFILGVY